MTDQKPVVLNGRYELHRRIARGGMAEVVLARDQLLDRPVAVKILFPEFATDAAFVERFRREAQAAANLNHPNIVGVYDWGREANTYFIVMEYVDGRSLADVLKAEGTLHPDRAADIVTDVAAALGFAHRNGVVHRDVKPGNVLISSTGLVKVTDFGIARAITSNAQESLTQTGSVMGTATYFSPEQAQGKTVDPRSDLYSLGVVMYELVCGQPPFKADNPVTVAYKHVQEQVPPIASINPSVPADYEAITMRLLAKSPSSRYASAEDLRSDLRRFREGQPVHAAGPAATTAMAAETAALTAVAASVDNTPPRGTMPSYDPYDAQPARRRTAWFVVALVAVLLAIGGLVFLFYKTLGAGGGETVTVPDVTRMSVVAAKAKLEADGFDIEVKSAPSDSIPENDVVKTDPAAGEKAKRGSLVVIFGSTGAGQEMPGVIGQQIDDAKATLLNLLGLDPSDLRIVNSFEDGCTVDHVLSTNPRPKAKVSAGDRITLTVCRGASTQVPNVQAGSSPEEAQRILSRAGYDTVQHSEYSSSIESGSVIGTDPPGGERLAKGEMVVIIVSSGPAPTTTQAPATTEAPATTVPATTAPATTVAPPETTLGPPPPSP